MRKLATHLYISALQRRCDEEGIGIYTVHSGDKERGSIVLQTYAPESIENQSIKNETLDTAKIENKTIENETVENTMYMENSTHRGEDGGHHQRESACSSNALWMGKSYALHTKEYDFTTDCYIWHTQKPLTEAQASEVLERYRTADPDCWCVVVESTRNILRDIDI